MISNNKVKSEGGLLQSKYWASIYRKEKKQVVNAKNLNAEAFGVIQNIKFIGKYLYIPRLFDEHLDLIEKFIKIAKENKCKWIRMDIENSEQLKKLQKFKIIESPHDMQPRDHLIIKIPETGEEILKRMKSKTRYNVRLAKKKGVQVEFIKYGDEDFERAFDAFFEMVKNTSKRKGVVFHNREHYLNMFKEIPVELISLAVAKFEDNYIAANIITFYLGVATYLHGATGESYRNLMAPFLLQFEAFKKAIKMNCKFYDFGGVFPDSDNAGKKGITRFKKGFAPKEEIYKFKGSYDLVIVPLSYNSYRTLLSIKKKIKK